MSISHLVNSKGSTQLGEATEAARFELEQGTTQTEQLAGMREHLKLLNTRFEEAFATGISDGDVTNED